MSTPEQPLTPSDEAWEAIPTGMRADELHRRLNVAADYLDSLEEANVVDAQHLAAILRGVLRRLPSRMPTGLLPTQEEGSQWLLRRL